MRARLSICLVTTFYPPATFGGDGVHVQRLAAALARRGHAVTVVCSDDAYTALRGRHAAASQWAASTSDDARITVHRLRSRFARLDALLVHQLGAPVRHRRRLKRLLAPPAPGAHDVIHFHNVSLVGGIGILGFGRAIKLYTAHEYWLGCATHLLYRYGREVCQRRTCVRCTLASGRPPQWWRYGPWRDQQLREVQTIICPSRLTQTRYREMGISRPTLVLPHFVPDAYLADAAAAGRRDDTQLPYCLYVGRLDAVKGVQHLLPPFAAGAAGAKLIIAGDGPLNAELRDRYAGNEHVRFAGVQSGVALRRLYRDALALVLPSAGYETFGQVIAEGFAHGTPALTTRVGGGKELIEASQAGFVYDDEAGLLAGVRRLVADAALRRELGERGHRYVTTRLTETAYVDRYERLVEDLRARCGVSRS